MSSGFVLGPARGDSLTSTCRRCGATFVHPNHSVHLTWREAHQLECPPPNDDRSAA